MTWPTRLNGIVDRAGDHARDHDGQQADAEHPPEVALHQAKDRVIAAMTPRRSSTISVGGEAQHRATGRPAAAINAEHQRDADDERRGAAELSDDAMTTTTTTTAISTMRRAIRVR